MKEERNDYVLGRKIEGDIKEFFDSKDQKCLLVTGARQTGKTYIIEKLGRENFKHFVKVDFIADSRAREIFVSAKSPQEVLSRLPLLTKERVEEGETLFSLMKSRDVLNV